MENFAILDQSANPGEGGFGFADATAAVAGEVYRRSSGRNQSEGRHQGIEEKTGRDQRRLPGYDRHVERKGVRLGAGGDSAVADASPPIWGPDLSGNPGPEKAAAGNRGLSGPCVAQSGYRRAVQGIDARLRQPAENIPGLAGQEEFGRPDGQHEQPVRG